MGYSFNWSHENRDLNILGGKPGGIGGNADSDIQSIDDRTADP
jgi:hypothetical protein